MEDTGELVKKVTEPYVLDDLPPGVEQKGAEIVIHPNGNWLYISNRGTGAIVVFDRVPADQGYLMQTQVN